MSEKKVYQSQIIAMKQWHKDHKPRLREIAKKYRDKTRKKMIDMLGGNCARCGFDDIRALQIDHIHGNGSKHRKAMPPQKMYRYYSKHLGEAILLFQVLCANCNWIKRFENDENP